MTSLQVVNILTINNRVSNRVYINMPCFYQLITIWFPPPMVPWRRIPPPAEQHHEPPPQQEQPPSAGESFK
jgi:hypothetical protein